MTTRLALVCSASTAATRAADFPANEPLDAHGLRRLSAVTERFTSADRVWASPARRAGATAQALGLDAVAEPALRDWDYGRWSGRSLTDVQASEPEAVLDWLRDPGAAPHGGETLLAVIHRTASWLDTQAASTGHVVAVTHAAIVRAAIVVALGAPPIAFWRVDIAPLSLTRLTFSHARWNVVAIGPLSTAPGTRSSEAQDAAR